MHLSVPGGPLREDSAHADVGSVDFHNELIFGIGIDKDGCGGKHPLELGEGLLGLGGP